MFACVCACRQRFMHVSRRRYTLTCTLLTFSQYLIVLLLVTQHQRIGESMVLAVGHIHVDASKYNYVMSIWIQPGI